MRVKNLLMPMILLTLLIAIVSYLKPFLVIDETRYVGVAWEMFNSGNYLVPTLNAIPYDHKPPLLFWLVNLDWALFGLNTYSLRFIPLVFALGIIYLNYKIYLLLWKDDKKGADLIAWITLSLIIFILYTTLFMFDIMLTFWTLLSIYAGIKAIQSNKIRDYLLLTFAVGFGILAKSPVLLAHLLPLYLFASIWAPKKVTKNFYINGFLSVIGGILIALVWALPAAKIGGEAFARGILWEQYAGRAVDAFAHKRPFWWYIPWIPLFLTPWILYSPFYNGLKEFFKRVKNDNGIKFILIWIGGAFVIFSLISGKQLHYILPEIPAFALLITRSLSLSKISFSAKIYGATVALLSIALLFAPWFIKGYIRVFLDTKAFIISSVVLLSIAAVLIFKKFKYIKNQIVVISISSVLIILLTHYIAHIYLKKQDLTKFSQTISALQKKGYKVAHYGKYHDQYHYFGRIKTPLTILHTPKEIDKFIKNNPDGAIITYRQRDVKYNKKAVIASTKFRTQNALLVKAKMWKKLIVK